MPIPNTSSLYQKIHKGAEGGHEFARFIRMLLMADYEAKGQLFISESDASGDYKKVDAYVPGDQDYTWLITAFQFKFFPSSLKSSHKSQIRDSIEAALNANEGIEEFILVTPEDFTKEDQTWLDSLRTQFEITFEVESNGICRFFKRQITHWGHSKIVELSLKHDHLGSKYFNELFPLGIGKFKLSRASIDGDMCNWLPSQENINGFFQTATHWQDHFTSDPIFDFRFKNNTDSIHLLNRIDIHIERVWSQLKGIPKGQTLISMGTLEYEIDFNKPINSLLIKDPIIFPAKEPRRFHLRLTNFVKSCPGNWAQLKFWFHFDEATIPTDSILLSF